MEMLLKKNDLKILILSILVILRTNVSASNNIDSKIQIDSLNFCYYLGVSYGLRIAEATYTLKDDHYELTRGNNIGSSPYLVRRIPKEVVERFLTSLVYNKKNDFYALFNISENDYKIFVDGLNQRMNDILYELDFEAVIKGKTEKELFNEKEKSLRALKLEDFYMSSKQYNKLLFEFKKDDLFKSPPISQILCYLSDGHYLRISSLGFYIGAPWLLKKYRNDKLWYIESTSLTKNLSNKNIIYKRRRGDYYIDYNVVMNFFNVFGLKEQVQLEFEDRFFLMFFIANRLIK